MEYPRHVEISDNIGIFEFLEHRPPPSDTDSAAETAAVAASSRIAPLTDNDAENPESGESMQLQGILWRTPTGFEPVQPPSEFEQGRPAGVAT